MIRMELLILNLTYTDAVILLPQSGRPQEAPSKGGDNMRKAPQGLLV